MKIINWKLVVIRIFPVYLYVLSLLKVLISYFKFNYCEFIGLQKKKTKRKDSNEKKKASTSSNSEKIRIKSEKTNGVTSNKRKKREEEEEDVWKWFFFFNNLKFVGFVVNVAIL